MRLSCARFLADFCYGNEDLAFSISEAIKLSVTVVAYAPESFRRCRSEFQFPFPLCFSVPLTRVSSLQMLMVLEALVPCYLQKLKSNTVTMESASAARDEIAAIAALATSLQALLYSSEALTRSSCLGLETACFCAKDFTVFVSSSAGR